MPMSRPTHRVDVGMAGKLAARDQRGLSPTVATVFYLAGRRYYEYDPWLCVFTVRKQMRIHRRERVAAED